MKKLGTITTSLCLGLATLAITATSASAVPITVPTTLNPGDQYRLAFVTDSTRDATSSNIADYNAFVTAAANDQAELAALGASWFAIGSTNSVYARDNTSTNPGINGAGVPIFRLDDTMIAANNADLWDGTLITPLNIDETGSVITTVASDVWTGTNPDGIVSTGADLGSIRPRHGWPNESGSSWVFGDADVDSIIPQRFYALSAVLTVPTQDGGGNGAQVPEPGTVVLFSVGLAGLGYIRRRRSS